MKRKFLVLCFLCLSLLFINTSKAMAADACSINSTSGTVKPGDTISVNFYLDNIDTSVLINKGYLELGYNNNILDYSKVSYIYDEFNVNPEVSDGRLKLTISSDSNTIQKTNGNVIILTVDFVVRSNVDNQDTEIIMYGSNTSYVTDNNSNNYNCRNGSTSRLMFTIYDSAKDAYLSDLSVSNGSLMPGFNREITNYTVNVGNEVSTIRLNGQCAATGCSVVGLGNKNLNVGKNVFTITVNSAGGVSRNYVVTVNREAEIVKDKNANLRSLDVSESELSPKFSSSVTEYVVEVENKVESIKINAVCAGIDCTVIGVGTKYLKIGENSYDIRVVAEDGTEKIYTIKVNRKRSLELSSVIIDEGTLSPNFDKNTLNYEIDVDNNVDSLDIRTETVNDGVQVKVVGNRNFKEGKNIVKLILSSSDSDETKTYTIIVNKKKAPKVENVEIEDKGIWDNEYVLYVGIAVGIIILLLIGGFVYYLLKKKGKIGN